jgi:Mrp family chromosome partitioning ATPase
VRSRLARKPEAPPALPSSLDSPHEVHAPTRPAGFLAPSSKAPLQREGQDGSERYGRAALSVGALAAAATAAALWFLLPQTHVASVLLHVAWPAQPQGGAVVHDPIATVATGFRRPDVLTRALALDQARELPMVQALPDRAGAVALLQRQIQVKPTREPGVVAVALQGSAANDVQVLLTAIADAYLLVQREEAARWQARRNAAQVRCDEAAARRRAQPPLSTSDRAALFRTQEQVAMQQARFREQFQQVQRDLDAKKTQLARHVAYKPAADALPASAAQADRLKQELKPLESFVKQLHTRLDSLTQESAAVKQTLVEDDRVVQDTLRLERDLPGLQSEFQLLQAEAAHYPNIRLHRQTECHRVLGNGSKLALTCLPVVAFCLAGVAMARRGGRGRRRDGNDAVTARLGVPVVGTVPLLDHPDRQRFHGVQAPEEVCGPDFAAAIDGLRAVLLADGQPDRVGVEGREGEPPAEPLSKARREPRPPYPRHGSDTCRMVMITSAVPGEGKSTLARHLALSLARTGRKTLLIDADLQRPSAHRFFEQTLQPGLSELFQHQASLAEAVRPTTTAEFLWLLPAGRRHGPARASRAPLDRLAFLERLREEFAFIVVDTAPVLGASDVLQLGTRVEVALLSVLRGFSRPSHVSTACQRLQAAGVTLRGLVVQGPCSV